jgi:hypothetical protein
VPPDRYPYPYLALPCPYPTGRHTPSCSANASDLFTWPITTHTADDRWERSGARSCHMRCYCWREEEECGVERASSR